MNTIKVTIEIELRGEGGLTQKRAIEAVTRALELRIEHDGRGRRSGLSHKASLIDAVEEEACEDFTDVVSVTVRAP